jgi:NAD(P)-dependent dehydrogenase (short-subunit alcohol dehydrogenase family)
MNLDLTGKTALVTAASGGIGSGVAEALAEAGVRVAISGRTLASLERVAETLASRPGGRPAIVVGDVCAKSGPARIATEAAQALGGRIDILVNNAGGARPITGEADDAYWEESLTLNFMAARRLTDLVIPAGLLPCSTRLNRRSSGQTSADDRTFWHKPCPSQHPREHVWSTSDSRRNQCNAANGWSVPISEVLAANAPLSWDADIETCPIAFLARLGISAPQDWSSLQPR